MERCDASIFAGGCDVRSGECRAGGRYAGPAVSPRRLHRGPEHAPRSTGQASISAARSLTARSDMKFTNSGQDLLAKLLNNVDPANAVQHLAMAAAAARPRMHGSGFGGFVGYNSQWTDVVIGLELNYTHGNFVRLQQSARRPRSSVPTDYVPTADATSSALDEADRLRLAARPRRLCHRDASCLTRSPASRWGRRTSTAGPTCDQYYVYRLAVPALPKCRPTSRPTDKPIHFVYGYAGGARHRRDAVCGPVPARRMGISSASSTTVETTINTVRAGLGYKF